nr:hypothetical protein [Tanacetum cinerariifolium]
CTVDELVKFSGETEVPKYMKIFILQQIAKARRYVNVLREEAVTARSCLAQLNVMISDMEVMDDHMEVTDIHKWTKTKAIRTKPSTRLEEHEKMKPTSGNLLNRTPRDALTIIENKSKVHTSKNKLIVSKQATVKAIEETCVTYGGPHLYYKCLATASNTFDTCASVGPYIQGGNGYRPQGDPNYHASNQMRPPSFPPLNVQNSQNYNQNRGPPKKVTRKIRDRGRFLIPCEFHGLESCMTLADLDKKENKQKRHGMDNHSVCENAVVRKKKGEEIDEDKNRNTNENPLEKGHNKETECDRGRKEVEGNKDECEENEGNEEQHETYGESNED